jgi:hypothetical protein
MFYKIINNKKSIATFVLAFAFVAASCTDLSENITDSVTAETFFQTEEEFVSALGDAYRTLTGIHGGGYSQVNEVTSDEVVIPARQQDWFEGGFWFRVLSHTWTPNEFNGAWTFLYSGVNNSNRLIFQFEEAVASGAADASIAEPIIAELRALRAFYYLNLLDIFGNVPIVDSFADAPPTPSQPSADFQQGRTAVFNFVEQELLATVPLLNDNVQATYARMNRYVGHMVLAKLYMNAEVYTGTARWSDAITSLDVIINSGNYNLSGNYFENFAINNSGSPENMFVVPFDRVFLPGFNLHVMTLHYASQATYNFQDQPWNGWSATQKMYETYTDPDKNPGPQGEVWGIMPVDNEDGLDRVQGTLDARTDNLIVGPQFSSSGQRLQDDGEYGVGLINGTAITFTPYINDAQFEGCRQCGARIGKYEFESGIGLGMSNDFVIYRYADVLLLKAEALWRLNGGSDPIAVELVNQVRARAGVAPFTSLDADKILDERMREHFYEMMRRSDQIRFAGLQGTTRYNDAWKFKEVSGDYRNVMPIPRVQLEANPNLVQNPGY